MPLEINIRYTEYVRVITYDKGQTYLHAFSIATGGWVNRGRAYASLIPFSEQIQGNSGDWELGEQILSASENGHTYEVEYSVRCAPIVESEISQSALALAILGPIESKVELHKRIGITHLQNAIQKFGYNIKEERLSSEDTMLTLEGPYTAEQFVKSLKK